MSDADYTLLFETTAEGFEAGDFIIDEMEGFEALSQPYEFHLTLTCTKEGGVTRELADKLLSSTSGIRFGPAGVRLVGGIVRELEHIDMEVSGASSVYRAILVPRFWRTTLTRRSRAFNQMSVPDIIAAVLTETGLNSGADFDLRLNGSYPAREYVVQYEETDFHFLSRWMERLGIYYFFEEGEGVEKLVITDENGAHFESPAEGDLGKCNYNYHDHHDQGSGDHGVSRFRRRHRVRPAKLHVRDYNWRSPARPVVGNADVDNEAGFGLSTYYGDHFKDDGEGDAIAKLRAELWQAEKEVHTGTSGHTDFAPGYRFTLDGSPSLSDLDGEYLITRVVHRASQRDRRSSDGGYSNEVEGILFSTQYRPPRTTAWPRIDGVVPAKIDAENISSAAPIDELGRYRVVVPFDLYGKFGGKASRWVRKAEPYAGGTYGMHMSLHVGAEVILAHVGGDPDRPIIVGSVPNPSMHTPLDSTYATRSALRTRSGILIDFEDDA